MESKTTTMKFKTLSARNGGQLEKKFSEWMNDGVDIAMLFPTIHSDHRGNLVMAIFYNDDPAIDPPEDCKLDPVKFPPFVPPPDIEEVLCPCCHTLTRPTTVQKGRWKGRLQCTSCQKTFEKKDAEPDLPTEGVTSNTVVEPPKIGVVTNG